jgi:O-antigen/teichoic acid export membrane protein
MTDMRFTAIVRDGDQIKRGTVLSYLNLALDNVFGLFLVPFVLLQLGQSEYGLYALMGSLVSYLVVLDLGLGNTIVRYVAKYRAEKDKEGETSFLATCVVMYAVLSLAVLVIGGVVLVNIPTIFRQSLTINEIAKARLLFGILVINLALSLPLNAFRAIANGYEQFVLPRLLVTIRTLVRPAILLLLLTSGFKSVAIVVLDTVLNLAVLCTIMCYTLFILKVRIRLYRFDRLLLREILGFSFFVFLGVIVNEIYWRIGHVLLGIYTNTAVVAVFSIGIQIALYFLASSAVVMELFLPRATQMVVNNDSGEDLTDLLIRVGRIQLMILGFMLTGFALLGRSFILLWVGQDYEVAWPIALIFMILLLVPLCQNTGISILMAKRLHAFRSVVYAGVALGNALIGAILTRSLGIWGPVVGTSLSLVLGNIVIINLYYHFKVGMNIPRFFWELCKGLLPAIFVSCTVGVLVLLIPGLSWRALAGQAILLSTLYWAMMWRFGMNNEEKHLVSTLFASLYARLKVVSLWP